jgi:hypothetical protein
MKEDEDIDPEIQVALLLSDKNHPIWRFLIIMATVLGALWASDTM